MVYAKWMSGAYAKSQLRKQQRFNVNRNRMNKFFRDKGTAALSAVFPGGHVSSYYNAAHRWMFPSYKEKLQRPNVIISRPYSRVGSNKPSRPGSNRPPVIISNPSGKPNPKPSVPKRIVKHSLRPVRYGRRRYNIPTGVKRIFKRKR